MSSTYRKPSGEEEEKRFAGKTKERKKDNESHGHYSTSLTNNDYNVGWVCALSKEQTASIAMLDQIHLPLPNPPNDPNTYTLGSVGNHNVVIACLPRGRPGNNSSATTASWMLSTFPAIRLGVMVGIGGGIPPTVRLGDVVVSAQTNGLPGVIQWDMGKAEGGGKITRTGSLNNPPSALLTGLAKLESEHEMNGSKMPQYLDDLKRNWPRLSAKYTRSDSLVDILFQPQYRHISGKRTRHPSARDNGGRSKDGKNREEESRCCHFCDRTKAIKRKPRDMRIHYGLIASGNQVVKDAIFRDRLNQNLGGSVLCVEMEAAGLMHDFPCVIIRGICDYADSHKNKLWQEHAAAIAAAFAKELLSMVPAQEKNQGPNIKESFRVQFRLSEVLEAGCFVGREPELAQMSEQLQNGRGRSTVVLHGLGGIGKTQLAAAYARRYRDLYSAVFWFNSKDIDSLKQSFLAAAEDILCDHPSLTHLGSVCLSGNVHEAVKAVKTWLNTAQNTEWLLVYDNYDSPKLPGDDNPQAFAIKDFLPEVDHGAVIIATRSASLKIGRQIPVKRFHDIQQSLEILSYTSRRENLDNDLDAHRLVRQLDGLPLALAAAGAYLDQVSTGFADYLRIYREKWLRVQEETPRLPMYEQTLYSTWDISLEHVRQRNPASVKLLQLWAYFDNEDLWFELLKGYAEAPRWFLAITEDQISFDSAMRALCCHALAESNNYVPCGDGMESRGYSMHSCVHSWAVHALNREWDPEMAKLAVACVGRHVPSRRNPQYWAIQQRLIRHANRSLYIIKSGIDGWCNNDVSMMEPLELIAKLYQDISKLSEAEELLQLILNIRKKSREFGAKHDYTYDAVYKLANLYRKQERLEESEKAYLQALQGLENSPQTRNQWIQETIIEIIDRLGIVYWKQKKLDKSEEMFVQALGEKEQKYGEDHDSTLNTVNNFGLLLIEQGKLAEAEKLLQRALAGYEDKFGTDHISTLNAVNNLGYLCICQGKLDKAEEWLRQAVKGYEKICTSDEIPFLGAVENLGDLYRKQGRINEAETMYLRALKGYKSVFGSSHSRYQNVADAIVTLKNLQRSVDLA